MIIILQLFLYCSLVICPNLYFSSLAWHCVSCQPLHFVGSHINCFIWRNFLHCQIENWSAWLENNTSWRDGWLPRHIDAAQSKALNSQIRKSFYMIFALKYETLDCYISLAVREKTGKGTICAYYKSHQLTPGQRRSYHLSHSTRGWEISVKTSFAARSSEFTNYEKFDAANTSLWRASGPCQEDVTKSESGRGRRWRTLS